MSAYIGLCLSDRVEIVTDGASYTPRDGVIRGFSNKVTAFPSHRVAMTTRGGVDIGNRIRDIVKKTLDMASGFDSAMSILGEVFHNQRDTGRFDDDWTRFEMMIAGFSEEKGPIIHYGSTWPLAGQEPFTLYDTQIGVSCGAYFTGKVRDQIMQHGGLRKAGIVMMEGMRRKPSIDPSSGEKRELSIVGGHVDFTVVSPAGVTTRRIHTWPDEVGRPVNLVGDNIVPMAGLSRQQRRAMKAEQRKKRRVA